MRAGPSALAEEAAKFYAPPDVRRGQHAMPAYVVQIRRESLGSGGPSFETVCALSDDDPSVLKLVKVALRLDDEELVVLRILSDAEARSIGLKPFQVKHVA